MGIVMPFISGFGIHFSCVYLYGVMLLLSVIISLHFWFRDLIREFYKKYEVLLMILFLACFIFLASEALLFISFFWGTFHSLSSPNYGMCPGEGLYVPDPCELTFANTLLLSNAAVSLGGAVVCLESSCSFSILFSLFSGILAQHYPLTAASIYKQGKINLKYMSPFTNSNISSIKYFLHEFISF